MTRSPSSLRRELLLAAVLVGIGLFALPPAVFWVGQRVVGEYTPDGGIWDLTVDIWTGVLTLNPMAWILVFSPYCIIQILRLSRLGRRRN